MFPNEGLPPKPPGPKNVQPRAKGQHFVLESPLDTAGSGYAHMTKANSKSFGMRLCLQRYHNTRMTPKR